MKLGPYEDLQEIGRGGMGIVYSARDPKLGRTVVLKRVLVNDEQARQRLVREARVLAALDHPYICRIYDIIQSDGEIYLVLEHVRGTSFEEVLKQRNRPLTEILSLVTRIAEALESAHARGVIHRDLKPSNFLLTPEGYPKILDFGLARLSDREADATKSMITTGTLLYMSPEQIRGDALDARSDIFSLGILLWEWLSGTHPFKQASAYDTMNRIVAAPPQGEFPSSLPDSVRTLIQSMLDKDPARRPQSMAAVRARLSLLGPHRDVRSTGRKKLSRVILALGAGLIAAALGLAALLLGLRDDAAPAATPVTAAVLPLANVGNDPETRYFSEGVTEEIITELSKVKAIRVLPRATVRRYRDSNQDARQIGAELKASHILEGSVQRYADRFRIAVRLVDSGSGSIIWTDDQDAGLKEIFEVEDRIAERVVERMNLELSPVERAAIRHRLTSHVGAYEEYLRARALQENNLETETALRQALALYGKAAQLDNYFAAAHAGISTCYSALYRIGKAGARDLERAESAARYAIKLDRSSEYGYTAMSFVRGNQQRWNEAVDDARRSLDINPRDPAAWELLSWSSSYRDPRDGVTAEDAARRAIELEPRSSTAHYLLGLAQYTKGNLNESLASYQKALYINPGAGAPHFGMARTYLDQGKYDQALQAIDRQLRLAPESGVAWFYKACILARLGRTGESLYHLAKAVENGSSAKEITSSDHLSSLRNDPRYQALIRRAGN